MDFASSSTTANLHASVTFTNWAFIYLAINFCGEQRMRLPIDFSDLDQRAGAFNSLVAHLRRVWPSNFTVSTSTTRELLIKAFGYESLPQMTLCAEHVTSRSFSPPSFNQLRTSVIMTIARYLTDKNDDSCTFADVVNAASELDLQSLKHFSTADDYAAPRSLNSFTAVNKENLTSTKNLNETEIMSISTFVATLKSPRDSLLLRALKSGLYPGDITTLRVDDSLSVCPVSGSYDQLPTELVIAMEFYIEFTNKQPGQFIFSASSHGSRPLTSRTLARIINNWVRDALPSKSFTPISIVFCRSLAKQRFDMVGKSLSNSGSQADR